MGWSELLLLSFRCVTHLYVQIHIQQNSNLLVVFPGCFYFKIVKAEITPVEPEQGNACEGKVHHSYMIPIHEQFIPVPKFIVNTKKLKQMKKLLGTTMAVLFTATVFAQTTIKGKATDKQGQPLEGASVTLYSNAKKGITTLTNQSGDFVFTGISTRAACKVIIRYVGFKTLEQDFTTGENSIQRK